MDKIRRYDLLREILILRDAYGDEGDEVGVETCQRLAEHIMGPPVHEPVPTADPAKDLQDTMHRQRQQEADGSDADEPFGPSPAPDNDSGEDDELPF